MVTEVWPILSPFSMNVSFQMRPSLFSTHRQIKPIERRESTELHLVPRRFAQGKAGSLYNFIHGPLHTKFWHLPTAFTCVIVPISIHFDCPSPPLVSRVSIVPLPQLLAETVLDLQMFSSVERSLKGFWKVSEETRTFNFVLTFGTQLWAPRVKEQKIHKR